MARSSSGGAKFNRWLNVLNFVSVNFVKQKIKMYETGRELAVILDFVPQVEMNIDKIRAQIDVVHRRKQFFPAVAMVVKNTLGLGKSGGAMTATGL